MVGALNEAIQVTTQKLGPGMARSRLAWGGPGPGRLWRGNDRDRQRRLQAAAATADGDRDGAAGT
jgi:hypothetical protein